MRGWFVFLLLLAVAGLLFLKCAYPFLAPNEPLDGGVLVVEGWGDDAFFVDAIREYDRRHYEAMFVTGAPFQPGAMFSEYGTVARFSAALVGQLSRGRISAQPIDAPEVRKDRTFSSALATREWMEAHGGVRKRITLFSAGPHSRRSWLLFRKAFGKSAEVGIIATEPIEYEADSWWRSGAGFRSVLSEAIAYGYARFAFWRTGE